MTSAADDHRPDPDPDPASGYGDPAALEALAEESAEDLYENAPCGYLSTLPDGRIIKINATLLGWLGHRREDVVGRKRFADLLTVGGRLYHETHFAPLLRMQKEVRAIALELRTAGGGRLPVLVNSVVRTDPAGKPLLIRSTVFDARDRRSYEKELLRARHEAERERRRLARVTATLQRTLLPPALEPVPGLDVAALYRIASPDEVGGDFYDLFPRADGAWALFLGDVRGKGAEAAVVTSLARYTLRSGTVYDPDPAAVLRHLNAVLTAENEDREPYFLTIIMGTLVPDTDRGGFRLTLAGGGHPPALLLRADGTAHLLETPGGQLLGVVPDADMAETTVHLAPGDSLLLYTDGLTEARIHGTGQRYGDEALLDFAARLAPATAQEVVAAVRRLLDGFGPGLDDDTAVLAIGVPASPRDGVRHPPRPGGSATR
ncbi:SpoIIE family protein phosphatase [Streptomyces pactum]|uniref:SpoIIE family protein phosphatase n=1 Tax=Streptomyces pactum TaxID=68249 RepID=A0ABS0NN58_9ACTN|nr:SpoIIE family protein phosphatase [Streptomyces pactum]MBH5336642.1 SpoIIE family protein phosphatase [Streptomyces pactum]